MFDDYIVEFTCEQIKKGHQIKKKKETQQHAFQIEQIDEQTDKSHDAIIQHLGTDTQCETNRCRQCIV